MDDYTVKAMFTDRCQMARLWHSTLMGEFKITSASW